MTAQVGTRTRHLHALRVPMRDDRTLRTDVVLPSGAGPWPATLLRTPYGRWHELPHAHDLCEDDVAVVVQDVAGRMESEGTFTYLGDDGDDAIDTIEWITAQPWSDGRVAMRGFSYRGFVQWHAALRRPAALRAIAPLMSPWWHRPPRFRAPGGAVELAAMTHWLPRQAAEVFGIPRPLAAQLYRRSFEPEQILTGARVDPAKLRAHGGLWRLPVADPWPVEGSEEFQAVWRAVFATPPARDPFDGAGPDGDVVDVPALVLTGWYDPSCPDSFLQFAHVRRTSPEPARSQHRMIVMPLGHGEPLPGFPADDEIYRFGSDPDHDWCVEWLHDRARTLRDLAPVTYYVLGRNAWESADRWPPAGATTRRLHLDARERALTERRPSEATAGYDYDPRDPVITRGGTAFKLPAGPMDQDGLTGGARPDVVSFTGPPEPEPVVLAGPVVVDLFASSSARDTDFTARLIDVAPNGRATGVCDGIVRARYRKGTRPELLAPGAVERYRIFCGHIAFVVPAGHRLRVDVSSSNFPRFDRNANTGAPEGTDRAEDVVVARQTIHTGERFPSSVTLTVLP